MMMIKIRIKINNIKMKTVRNGKRMMGNNRTMINYGMILARMINRVNKTLMTENKNKIRMNFRTMINQENLDRVLFQINIYIYKY